MNYDIVSIGAATVDIFISSPSVKLTDGIISFKSSSKNEINSDLICSGGGATNSVTTFSRLKLTTNCISLLGSDPLSEYVLSDLNQEKIDTSFLRYSKKDNSDFSVIIVGPDGSRTVFTNRGSSCLENKHIPWSRLKKIKWFYITSLEGNLDLLETFIGFAKENKISLALNPGSREIASPQRLLSLISHIDFLLLNQTESEALSGLSSASSSFWDFFLRLSPTVAITNGRLGAHLLTDTDHLYSPIINVRPVDETGAGDAFGSAAVAALIYGHSPQTVLEWGIKNSASVVSCLGAKKGILNLKQIKSNTPFTIRNS
jgi:sugar/nucleoside kinase (ribokinase family)